MNSNAVWHVWVWLNLSLLTDSSGMFFLDLCGINESAECICNDGNPYKANYCCNETDSNWYLVDASAKGPRTDCTGKINSPYTPKRFLIYSLKKIIKIN